MKRRYSINNLLKTLFILIITALLGIYIGDNQIPTQSDEPVIVDNVETINKPQEDYYEKYQTAEAGLNALEVKGRAPKTGYKRSEFGNGWDGSGGCDTRNRILARDLTSITYDINSCTVLSGTLNDPYLDKIIYFQRGNDTSKLVQIDHVVSLSDAWQKGAQSLSPLLRIKLANDSLNLLAVDGSANQNKSDGDAATWLPANKAIRCSYIARQISVKLKYSLWVTIAEKNAMQNILRTCPEQELVS